MGLRYRRALLLTELGEATELALAALRRTAPALERLVVVARMPAGSLPFLSAGAPTDLHRIADEALTRLREEAAAAAAEAEVMLATSLDLEALDSLAAERGIELVATASMPLGNLPVLIELRRRRGMAVLWTPPRDEPPPAGPMSELACVCMGRRASAAVATFLRDRVQEAHRVTVLTLSSALLPDLAAVIEIAGIPATVEVLAPEGQSAWSWLEAHFRTRSIELAVVPRLPALLLGGPRLPVLLLPPVPVPRLVSAPERGVDAADVVHDGGALRARFEHAVGLGRRTPIPDQEIALVADGRIVARVTTRDGDAVLPVEECFSAYGYFRTAVRDEAWPVAAVEQRIQVVRPGERPLVLFDAGLPDEALRALAAHAQGGDASFELLAVRIRPMQPCRAIRLRLHAMGLPPRVIDCRAVLDEGDALDVPEAVDPVRLARVGARLRTFGFPVAAIVHDGDERPATVGFAALRADELAGGRAWPPRPIQPPGRSRAARLDACVAAPLAAGNRVAVELDNVQARRWLMEAIGGARDRVHLQTYMMADDDIGRLVETALAQAGARGVTVRVLVDSLHGLHGSLKASNPILERLGAAPGVELRVSDPITGLPTLKLLKQRDHRKMVVVDNQVALVGGRNVSHEYYTGFDEVALTAESSWREVPWLDAGARVEGPVVSQLEHAFNAAWQRAGGKAFHVIGQGPAGDVAARLVLHEGLRDAWTLEAYLALIETATSHVDVVNGFPLILEIQHALLRALRRGLRVRALFGHLTPTHDGTPFEGPWATARSAATELVHSRMDALVAAGAEGYQFLVAQQRAWQPGLGPIASHVHAKLMSVDGRACAVGSANMDITGGYWESELLLLVEDARVAEATEAHVGRLIAASRRVERDDPVWRQLARRREWLRHWPGVLSV